MTQPPVSITTRSIERPGGVHVDVTVFAGPAGGTRANAGTLTLRADEARELVERLGRGEVPS